MRRVLPWAVAASGLALVVLGVLVARPTAGPGTVTYGGSYEPLVPPGRAYTSTLEVTLDGTVTWWTTGDLVGPALAGLGALVLAAVGGWALGRRAARPGARLRPRPGVSSPACLPGDIQFPSVP